MYLATQRWGRQHVMGFARWGMSGAQPVFCNGRHWRPGDTGDVDFDLGSWMAKASELPIFAVAPDATSREDERVYRADLAGIRNPDAEFIAHARADVDALLAEVDRLRAQLDYIITGGDDRCCTLDLSEGHEGPCVWYCAWCNGAGECPDCNGTGPELAGCESCDTTGSCRYCNGAGRHVDDTPAPRPVETLVVAGERL
ncbi:hypothetical protein Val02_81800 [Virgisporangium aliadipatigenens]|uniref:Uncharacterized protein n=2 Tax=Virgisporangium aliadipatigenens TaxID=741659 RepID=A0A8J4DUZ2_9ACTN|nr:hypothetical protein Val02_81800 [Virgisporangium aliadipatigenens]